VGFVVGEWHYGGFKQGATYFFRNRYDSEMDIRRKEVWDRLDNEPERAYRAFESFLSLPSGERTLLEAYRRDVDNADAVKPSDTWSRWCNDFAWRERAAAYDDHLASVRRDAYERVIEEEQATWFVITVEPPALSAATGRVSRGSAAAYTEITMTVQPWGPADTVRKFYRQLQGRVPTSRPRALS
jgi:hypothetical protein